MKIKNTLIRIVWIFLLTTLSVNSYSHVELDYPKGGEKFTPGEKINIQWHIVVTHEQLNWELYFSLDNGVNWTPLSTDLPVSQLEYEWTVPDLITNKALIKVVQKNNGANYEAVSNTFKIAEVFSKIDEIKAPKQLFVSGLNGRVSFHFELQTAAVVYINIYELDGRLVRSQKSDYLSSAENTIEFDFTNVEPFHPFVYQFVVGQYRKAGIFYPKDQ